jgi:hypothetical protein
VNCTLECHAPGSPPGWSPARCAGLASLEQPPSDALMMVATVRDTTMWRIVSSGSVSMPQSLSRPVCLLRNGSQSSTLRYTPADSVSFVAMPRPWVPVSHSPALIARGTMSACPTVEPLGQTGIEHLH